MTDSLPGFLQGWPVWVVFGVLFLGAYARGNATYWVGRGARAGGARSRWSAQLASPVVQGAERWVRRMGPPLVSIGFLTVGVQSAINFSAGALRMPQRRFQPAVVVGALLWATLYTTVGFAVVDAFLGRLPWWVLLVAALAVWAVVWYSRWLTRRAEFRAAEARVAEARVAEARAAEARAAALAEDHREDRPASRTET